MRRILIGLSAVLLASFLSSCQLFEPPPPNACWAPPGSSYGLSASSTVLTSQKLRPLGDFSLPHVPGEILVKGEAPTELLSALGASEKQKKLPPGWRLLKVPAGSEYEAAVRLLSAGASAAEPNYYLRPLRVPNDTYYDSYQKSYMEGLLHLEEAWDVQTGAPSLTIAVVDTGYLPHPDLASRIVTPLPNVKLDTADEDQDPTDDTAAGAFGHGLAVAGIIGAVTNNDEGIAGVTWSGQLLPIKVFPSGGDTASEADIVEALIVAREQGAKIVNLSLGFSGMSNLIEDELQAGYQAGTVYVAASGNANANDVYYPAKSAYTLAVGAVDGSKNRADFSNYGSELDLVAPGVSVAILAKSGSNYAYAQGDGTSFATPIVTGVAALYMQAYLSKYGQHPTSARVFACLRSTAEDLGASGKDPYYGNGLVRPDRILLTKP